MCGIAGLWGEGSSEKVRRMLEYLTHRGPDGHGIWQNHNLSIGHARLAINDLSDAGKQPMASLDRNVVISVNGEIYNYSALKKELEALGCSFLSRSDSEVVLHAWRMWREKSFIKFNGMFAISLYDASEDRLYLVRDRLGIKPLYYIVSDDMFAFASELKAFRELKKTSIDYQGLYQYLTYQNYFSGRTLVDGVALLEPGTYLCFDGKQHSIRKFWELDQKKDEAITFDDAVYRYKKVLDVSVERHLLSDVPVASYLSAGFDAATVAQRASVLRAPPVTFTGAFTDGNGWYDEDTVASLISSDIGSEHVKVEISADDLPRVFDHLVYSLDEPRMGMGAFPQYCVAEQVAKTHKVVLTGHGGDELFSGYPIFKLINLLANKNSGNILKQLASIGGLKKAELPHLAYFLMSQFRSQRYRQFLPVLHGVRQLKQGLKPEVWRRIEGVEPHTELAGMGFNEWNKEEMLYSHYLRSYLNGLLVVEDKISMAHSIESRTPLLDNELLDLSLSIPQSIKVNKGALKAIIKEGGIGRLPPVLYQQPKRGFPTPLRLWLRGPLKGWAAERISGSNSSLHLLFREEWLTKTFNDYQSSLGNKFRPLDEINSHRMWQLLCLESWLRQNV